MNKMLCFFLFVCLGKLCNFFQQFCCKEYNMIEFLSGNYARPFRVLPELGIMYFPCDLQLGHTETPVGHLVKCRVTNIEMYMYNHIIQGGDFSFCHTQEGNIFALKITDIRGETVLCTSMWTFKWEKQLSALRKIQRWGRNLIFLYRLKNNELNVLKEFKSCFKKCNVIPYEMILKILGMNTNKPVGLKDLKDLHQHQNSIIIRCVETKSFKRNEGILDSKIQVHEF